MDSHVRRLAARQADVVAAWQLLGAGWSRHKLNHHVQKLGWRRLHSGVYVVSHAPVTRRQLWFAAALTAPDTYLSHGSAGACYGFHRFDRHYEVVTRSGSGGRRRHGRLLVYRSNRLEADVTTRQGIPITAAARVLVDLAPALTEKRVARAFREAIRLKTTTARRVLETTERHRGREGTPLLGELATRYAAIPYARTRSDAEARALELLHDAAVRRPANNVDVAGEEADLVWPEWRLIVEIDGPQFHAFPAEDARKERRWRAAGYTVRRVSSAVVYDAPAEFLAVCTRPWSASADADSPNASAMSS